MLQIQPRLNLGNQRMPPVKEDVSLLQGIDVVALMAMLKRHTRVIVISVITCLALALLFSFLSDVKYTAQTSVLIGNRQLRSVQDISAQTNLVAESALVDNQTEVIKSERVMLAVMRSLNLKDDPEFNGTETPPLPIIIYRFVLSLNPMRLFSSGNTVDPEYRMERTVIARLAEAIKITRSGKSNVLQIAVTVKSPGKAARIADGVTAIYLADQVNARMEAAKAAAQWFKAGLEELREDSFKASNAVEDYRRNNNLLSVNGQLVTDQQFNQLSNDLAQARSEVVRKQAQYDQLKAELATGRADTFLQEANNNSTITQLRQSQAELRTRYTETANRVGANHEQSIRILRAVEDKARQISEQMGKYLEGYQNELSAAKKRQEALEQQIANASRSANENNAAMVKLRQLEQQATIVKGQYQSFLQRYQDTIQQESNPTIDARIIADAAAPLLPSEPRTILISAIGIVLGLGIGVGIGAFRELSDRAYRTAEQLETDTGVEVFGLLPNILDPSGPADSRVAETGLRVYTQQTASDLAEYAIKHPYSSYAETLRSVKMGLDSLPITDRAKILGVVSSMPREGKSTVSVNLASLLALQGSRVILIDADLREAGLTRLTALKPAAGLGEVLLDQASLSAVLTTFGSANITVLPATVRHNFFVSGDLISSPAMATLLSGLAKLYDYVIVDLPPIGPVVDGRAAAQLLDATLMVVEWGNVPRRIVRTALASSTLVREKLVGSVLNKVEIDKLRTYEPYGLDSRQEEVFNRYYR